MSPPTELKFAIFGTGFWSRYQLSGWQEIKQARCVALYNRTRSKAEDLARIFEIPSVYDNPDLLLEEVQPDFVDIITDVESHDVFTELCMKHRVPAICQKPMAPSLERARRMVAMAREEGLPLLIHENWRWQKPIRALKRVLDAGRIGKVFRAHIEFANSFPVFDNQPFLKELDHFLLMDIGTHILDVARFLFGEAKSVCCQTQRIHADIRGEDVATVLIRSEDDVDVAVHMSYASPREQDRFPETFIHVEAEKGSAELAPDFWVKETTGQGTFKRRVPPCFYDWCDPRYALVQSSIVDCNRHLLNSLLTGTDAETFSGDNLKTVELVFACYESAANNSVQHLHH